MARRHRIGREDPRNHARCGLPTGPRRGRVRLRGDGDQLRRLVRNREYHHQLHRPLSKPGRAQKGLFMATITTIKIHPAIGVARLGNSPEVFIGPELPGGHTPPPPDGNYKDVQCRMKKQAARFRLFGYDAGGVLVQEITAADATITWTAHLANTKAPGGLFHGASTPNPGLRTRRVAP